MLLRFPKSCSWLRVYTTSVCVSLGLSWNGESVLECQDIWRGKWVKYCMVRLDGCEVVPAGQDKAGGGQYNRI